MKKLWMILALTAIVSACSEKSDSSNDMATETAASQEEAPKMEAPKIDYENQLFEFDVSNLNWQCDKNSEIVCALDLAVKCTLDPKKENCTRDKMPDFIFMEDEFLERPTKMSYRITKLKPVDANTIEVYTKGNCNGNWMGLCNGNVIYVMGMENGSWVVKEIYAIQ